MAECEFPLPQLPALEPRFLNGWKEISIYLGRGVRTVQRYERLFALPVRRALGSLGGSVVALSVELDQWTLARPTRALTKARSDFRTRNHLTFGLVERRRLCSDHQELMAGIASQRAALESSVDRVVQSLTGPDFLQKNARHAAVAEEQRELARTMIQNARKMSDRSVSMRKPLRQCLLPNC